METSITTLDNMLEVGTIWTDDTFGGRGKIISVECGSVVWGGKYGLNVCVSIAQFLREFTAVPKM